MQLIIASPEMGRKTNPSFKSSNIAQTHLVTFTMFSMNKIFEAHSWDNMDHPNGQSSRPAAGRSGLWAQPCQEQQNLLGLAFYIWKTEAERLRRGQGPKPYNQRKKRPQSSHWKANKSTKDRK